MTTVERARSLALGLPDANEVRKDETRIFAVGGKVFAMLRHTSELSVVLDPSEARQVFAAHPDVCQVVEQGGSAERLAVNLKLVRDELVEDLLIEAWFRKAQHTLFSARRVEQAGGRKLALESVGDLPRIVT